MPHLSSAQSSQPIHYASGTGFFISTSGHIVTNEHVVKGCTEVAIRGAVEPMTARVIKIDAENDLALLQADTIPLQTATVSTTPLGARKDDKVMVIGYPMERATTGEYLVKESQILATFGPMKEPKWLQFADAAQQGNSGGPLLDTSGHVIGVIVGKSKLMMFNPLSGTTQLVKESDVAISLPILIRFLEQHGVYFRRSSYITYLSPHRVEDLAKDYIVNIHCQQAE